MMREIIVRYGLPSGGGHLSVFYFDTSPAVADQRAALADLMTDIAGAQSTTITWRLDDAGRELDETTGTLTGAWSSSVVYSGAGGFTGDPVPDASQMLIRWATDTVINGRFLQGRTFVPGIGDNQINGGNVNPTLIADLAADCQDFIDANVLFGIWHRPTDEGPGSHEPATSASIWSEWSVLRRRRG